MRDTQKCPCLQASPRCAPQEDPIHKMKQQKQDVERHDQRPLETGRMFRFTKLALHALPKTLLAQVCMAGAGFQNLIVACAEGCLLQAEQEYKEIFLSPAIQSRQSILMEEELPYIIPVVGPDCAHQYA